MAYVMGRNHSEFVESEREDLTMKQRVERMAAARVADLEEKRKVKPSRVGRGRADEGTAKLFGYEKGESAGTDAKRQTRKAERLVLEDLDAKFGRMPKPSVKVNGLGLRAGLAPTSALLEIEWVRKGHHDYVLEYQKMWGTNMVPWVVVYKVSHARGGEAFTSWTRHVAVAHTLSCSRDPLLRCSSAPLLLCPSAPL